MQCRNCQFENMPGVPVCGRCGTSLRLATAVLDVHPPRAMPWRKRLRRFLPTRKSYPRPVETPRDPQQRGRLFAWRDLRLPLPEWRLVWRLIVPGWAHFACGQVRRGRLFLGIYLALLGLALLFAGTTLGSIFLGLAFSAHASAALDILYQYWGEWRTRIVGAAVVMAVLGIALYWPAGWFVTRFADPQMLGDVAAPFQPGDAVLCNQWAYLRSAPKAGDVVRYQFPRAGTTMTVRGIQGNVRTREGDGIDRILAAPGDEVRWEDGELVVNGQASPWKPLNPERVPPLSLTVPPGCYLILPSVAPFFTSKTQLSLWKTFSLVPESHILGKVYVRHQPLWRLWVIR
jgi:hypothetical protein